MVPFHLLGAPLAAAIIVSRTPEARDCPDTEHLIARVERIIGRPLPDRTPTALSLRAEFSRLGATYEAKVQLAGTREGERLLRDDGPTCDALADAVAVTTALLVDASERPPAPAADRPSPPPTSRPWFELWLTGHFGMAAGLVGGPTWVTQAGLDTSLGPLTTIELSGSATGSRAHRLGTGLVHVQLWYVGIGVFRSLTGENVRLGPYVQLLGGALRGAGDTYPATSSASLAWFAAGAGLRGELNLTPDVRLGARVLALAPTRKHSFSIGYVGTAYESNPLAGVAEIGLGVKLW